MIRSYVRDRDVTTQRMEPPLRALPIVSYSLFLLVTTGCASMFLNGAKLADHDYATSAKANYKAEGCVKIAGNTPVKGPNATYHLVEEAGQPAFFERSEKGTGSV